MALRIVVLLVAIVLFTTNALGVTDGSRCVFIDAGTGYGTGIILHKNQVVVDAHEIPADGKVKVNGKEAVVERIIPPSDLAFLAVETPNITPVRWGDAVVGDEVYYIGKTMDHKCIMIKGVVVELAGDYLFLDMKVLPGSSGSGLYNKQGELVGIIQQLEQYGPIDGFGKALASSVIRKNQP